jgi:cytidyltransferase-like protein
MKKIVLVSGGFDPLHSGHIAYFKEAKTLGDYLIVGLNSDAWLTRKKGRPFMPSEERHGIVTELDVVDEVYAFDEYDDADGSCIKFIENVLYNHPDAEVIFANGGDRTNANIPEMTISDSRLKFEFGVGGEHKKNSSSWILKEWSQPATERLWGKYTVLDKGKGWATKKLEFDAGKALSDQRHFKRSEHWHVVEGCIQMAIEFPNGDKEIKTYTAGNSIDIPVLTWHKATNVGDITATVIEVWMGEELSEEDIERRD